MAGRREVWMDTLRGWAMLMMLVWHAPAVPALLGVAMPEWIRTINSALIPFRMPTLMVLSGLLLERSLSKRLPEYYGRKFQLIAWPYVVWALIHNLTYESIAPLWHPRAWIANGYLWFLFYILCFYAVAPLFRRVHPLVMPVLMFTGSVLITADPVLHQLLYFGGFFFAGHLAARYRLRVMALIDKPLIGASCGAVAIGWAAFSATTDIRERGEFAVLSLIGIAALMHVARRLNGASWTRPLQFVGRNSIIYYTTHFPVMHLATLILLAAGVTQTLVVYSIMLTLALAVGTFVAHRSHRAPLGWLFTAPFPTIDRLRRSRPAADVTPSTTPLVGPARAVHAMSSTPSGPLTHGNPDVAILPGALVAPGSAPA